MADRPTRQIKITRPMDPGDPTQRTIINELAQRRAALGVTADRLRSQRWRPLAFGLTAQVLLGVLSVVLRLGVSERLRVIVAVVAVALTGAAVVGLMQDWLRLRRQRRAIALATPWLPSTGIIGQDGLDSTVRDTWPVWAMVAGLAIGLAFVFAVLLPSYGEWLFRLIGVIA